MTLKYQGSAATIRIVTFKEMEAHVLAVEAELEIERMRVAACGVVAMANTPATAERAREMHREYWCASVADVARIVDAEMAGRTRITELESENALLRAAMRSHNTNNEAACKARAERWCDGWTDIGRLCPDCPRHQDIEEPTQ